MNHNIQTRIRDLRLLKVKTDQLGPEATAFERGLYLGLAIGVESHPTVPAWEVHYLRNIRKHWRHGL